MCSSTLFIHSHLNTLRSEEHTSELQSPCNLVCRLLLEKKKKKYASDQGEILVKRSEVIVNSTIPHAVRAAIQDSSAVLLVRVHRFFFFFFFFLMIRRPPISTLFPSTPLFRSLPDNLNPTLWPAEPTRYPASSGNRILIASTNARTLCRTGPASTSDGSSISSG